MVSVDVSDRATARGRDTTLPLGDLYKAAVGKRIKDSRRYKTVEVTTAVAVLGVTSLSARDAAIW